MSLMAVDEHADYNRDFDPHRVPVVSPQPGEAEFVDLTAHIGPHRRPFVEIVVNGQAVLVSLHDLLLVAVRMGMETEIDLDGSGA